jgi:hypothetical protein
LVHIYSFFCDFFLIVPGYLPYVKVSIDPLGVKLIRLGPHA